MTGEWLAVALSATARQAATTHDSTREEETMRINRRRAALIRLGIALGAQTAELWRSAYAWSQEPDDGDNGLGELKLRLQAARRSHADNLNEARNHGLLCREAFLRAVQKGYGL